MTSARDHHYAHNIIQNWVGASTGRRKKEWYPFLLNPASENIYLPASLY